MINISKEDLTLKAWIGNLGKYNEGELVGEWVELPISEKELNKVLERIGISDKPDKYGRIYEETFIADYENNIFDLGEYESFETLNVYGRAIEKIMENNLEDEFLALRKTGKFDVMDTIANVLENNVILYDAENYAELGQLLIEECYGDDIPKDLTERYIDYKSLGRNVRLGYWQESEDKPGTASEYWCGNDYATDTEIGEEFVSQVGIDSVSNLENYFDYNTYGRDCSFDGYYLTTDNGCIYTGDCRGEIGEDLYNEILEELEEENIECNVEEER